MDMFVLEFQKKIGDLTMLGKSGVVECPECSENMSIGGYDCELYCFSSFCLEIKDGQICGS